MMMMLMVVAVVMMMMMMMIMMMMMAVIKWRIYTKTIQTLNLYDRIRIIYWQPIDTILQLFV